MMRALRTRLLTLSLILVIMAAAPGAQDKKVLGPDDYPTWRSISGQALSGDGAWVAYTLQFTNTADADAKPELRLRNLTSDQETTVAHGTGATFSGDSRWVAYTVDPSGGGRGGRGGRAGGAPAPAPPTATPPAQGRGAAAATPAEPRRVELRNLATGAVRSWQDIASFDFTNSSTHLLLRRRPAQAAGGGGRGGEAGAGAGGGGAAPAAPAAPAPRGVDVIVHNLATGKDVPLGSVGDSAFNRAGTLLAYTVDGTVKDGNGLFLFDLADGRVTALDNSPLRYTRLTWNDQGTGLAVLKGADIEKMRERPNQLLVYPDLQAAIVVDPQSSTALEGFPADWVISDRAPLDWNDAGTRVFFGIKAQEPIKQTPRRNPDTDADVDIWHTRDERVQSQQMIRATQDQNVTFRQAYNVSPRRYVSLSDETMRDVDAAPTGRWAVGRDTRGYIHDFNTPAADFYRVDLDTGERTLMFKGQALGSGVLGFSPDGRHYLYWKDNRVHSYTFETGASRVLGGPKAPSFVDEEFDRLAAKPSYGIAGYTADDRAVIMQHRYDLWVLPLDGAPGTNLTRGEGTKQDIRFRIVRTTAEDPLAEPAPGGAAAARQRIDLTKPVTLSAYGQWTKKSGFYTLDGGRLTPVVYEDASFSTPGRALHADTFLFTRQTFVEFPDLRVSGADFSTSRKISDANPHQAEFLWGRRILFDYKNKDGVRLQGILGIPDDYKPGEKRPMLVTFYEKNSQNLNRYSAPSYLTGMGASPIEAISRGYLTLMPDIHFRGGSSHSDMLECVEAAVREVIRMGYVDPARIGVTGHSYGGEGAAFIAGRSKMFAAVGMGAGVTDLYSDFNQNWGWSYQVTGGSGANGHNYYLVGQGRWGFSPWDKPEVYRFESGISHAKDVIAPVLIMHGTADPTVGFAEGLNFYNALRYFNKNAILLAYPGEGHGLRGLANRRDLTVRFFEFFDHYLKGAKAPAWVAEGVPHLKK